MAGAELFTGNNLIVMYEFGDGAVGLNALAIANTKASLGWGQAVALGVLCNALVCLAVWLSYAARSVTDKVLAVLFPITAFVARGSSTPSRTCTSCRSACS